MIVIDGLAVAERQPHDPKATDAPDDIPEAMARAKPFFARMARPSGECA